MAHSMILGRDFLKAQNALPPRDQARVNEFLQRFQENPGHPGISLERIRSAEGDLWSARVSQEIRAVLYKDGETWAVLHVDRHDPAYDWARRKKVGRHSVTGALQVVDVERAREVREEAALPDPSAWRAPPLFAEHGDDYLLSLGVPEDWLPTIREVRTEDDLLRVCEDLHEEDVVERLLTLAGGELVTPPTPAAPDAPVEEVPDTRRTFFVSEDEEELRAVLEQPLEQWIGFLHPSQRDLVKKDFSGPVKVTGSAGTGKTVVAVHRAREMARRGHRVFLGTFMGTLAQNLERNLDLLCRDPEVRGRITASTVHTLALETVRKKERINPARDETVKDVLRSVAADHETDWDPDFVASEWSGVIDAQGITEWSEYRSARRVGRGTALSVRDRRDLWTIFSGVRERLEGNGHLDWTGITARAARLVEEGEVASPVEAVIVDELQDLKAVELRFIRALAERHPANLMLVGDAGQRIYPGGFSLLRLGIDIRGRSHILRINYRTSEQIRSSADRIVGGEVDDMAGGTESRAGTRSLFTGPEPELAGHQRSEEETATVAETLQHWMDEGLAPEELAVFARSNQRAQDLQAEVGKAGLPTHVLRRDSSLSEPGVRFGTMHRAKGLEFKGVVVAGAAEGLLPAGYIDRDLTDPADVEEALARERRLLYVTMTRARDRLLVTWAGAPSRYLAPLLGEGSMQRDAAKEAQ